MLNKAFQLISSINENHICVCHGKKTMERYFMALLSSQTQHYHISNNVKIGHLSELKIVLFVTSVELYAKQSIWTSCLRQRKAYMCVPWWKGIGKTLQGTAFNPNSKLPYFKYCLIWPFEWGENCIICNQCRIIC